MPTHDRPRSRDEFEIAIICALRIESDAVEALFDEFWEEDDTYGKAPGDSNAYTTGRIGAHDVVLAFMPGMGKGAAAGVAASFRSSFPHIKLGLVVGICGGVPISIDQVPLWHSYRAQSSPGLYGPLSLPRAGTSL